MPEIDVTLRDYGYPNEGYDGQPTFVGVLRSYFPRWCLDAKANGLLKNWSAQTAADYARHYKEKIFPRLDPNKPLHSYEEEDFDSILDDIQEQYHYKDATMEHYRNLLWIVYRAGFRENLYADSIFWGEVYDPSEHSDDENEVRKAYVRTVLRKSLSKDENLAFLKWFSELDPETASGEDIGLLFMYFDATRNHEACGINFGHIYQLEKYISIWLLDVAIQTTEIGSNRTKGAGKTGNAPRVLMLVRPFLEFLIKRRQSIERKIAAGEFVLPPECKGKIEHLPVVCKGLRYGKRCSSKDLSVAGRALLEKLGIRKGDLAELHQILRSRAFKDAGIDEKEVTTYLLRRNFGTILYILGFSEADIQYYLGHSIEDPDIERNYYTNKDKLLPLYELLNDHPVYAVFPREEKAVCESTGCIKNNIAEDVRWVELRGESSKSLLITADANEPSNSVNLQVEACAENPSTRMEFEVEADVSPAMKVFYPKTVNIRHQYFASYLRGRR